LNRTIAARWRGWPSQPALSLGGLRRRIEALMLPDDVIITLNLDLRARRERDRRRQQAQLAR
jgi:hypothetical protein